MIIFEKELIYNTSLKPGLRVKLLVLLKARGRSMRLVPHAGTVLSLKKKNGLLSISNCVFNYRFKSSFVLNSKNIVRLWVY